MKNRQLRIGYIFLPLLFVPLLVLAGKSDPEAIELLRKNETLLRSAGTITEYQVKIVRRDWNRTLVFRSHDDYVNEQFRIEILSPRKIKGTVFLKSDKRLSMYLPKLRRAIAISPAMMHDPWMGSDFNNQDLIESDSLIGDYTHRILSRTRDDTEDRIVIESVPKPDAPVAWGKLRYHLQSDGLPLQLEYYDSAGTLVRSMSFSEPKEFGNRTVPTRMTMQPSDRPDQHTEINIEDVQFDVAIGRELFVFNTGKAGKK
jgi:outer membrane lipoprotein-sorting protein